MSIFRSNPALWRLAVRTAAAVLVQAALPLPAAADEAPRATHTDLTIGAGTLTAGLGLGIGHRMAGGLRLDFGVGTAAILSGLSMAAGGSFALIESPRDRLELPVEAAYVRISCGECGTDGAHRGLGGAGAMLGLDWIHGELGTDAAAFALTLRLGAVSSVVTEDTGDSSPWETLLPIAQLGLGWAF